MDAYGEFLASVTPTVLGLDRSNVELDRFKYFSARAQSKRLLSSKYVLAHLEADHFDVIAAFDLRVLPQSGTDEDRALLGIRCEFTGHFHADPPVQREHAEKFTETDAWILFWPYFRQFVSDVTARMAIPPVLIPLGLGPGDVLTPRQPQTDREGPKPRVRGKRSPKRLPKRSD